MSYITKVVKFALLLIVCLSPILKLHADEQPPYDVAEPSISENFRNIYLLADKLSLLTTLLTYTFNSSSNTLCIDGTTLCINSVTHTVMVGTNTITFPSLAGYAVLAATQTFNAANTFQSLVAIGTTTNPNYYLNLNTVSGQYALRITGPGTEFINIGAGDPEISASGEKLLIRTLTAHAITLSPNVGALGTTMSLSAAGEVTQPLQPSFLATNATGDLNVTGDGTDFPTNWPTEVYDQGSDFASNTFTAPVDGKYLLTFTIEVAQLTALHNVRYCYISTSNRNYVFGLDGTSAGTDQSFSVTAVSDMEAGDTARPRFAASGSGKTVDIEASASGNTFSGSLIN